MDYPFWDVGIGYGILMAAIAVVHVFISQFAIGGGLYLVVSEHWARRRGDEAMLGFLEKLTKFFILVTLVAGAVTGVAIWFIIGLLNPAATEALIHNFVWGWAIEWTFFVVEIAAAIVYYYGWKTMRAREHLIVGWIYFGAAWLSLFVINGIITFMLTPGEWIRTGSFWDGFFNPTFWPSLVLRTGLCVMLAGLYTIVVASRLKPAAIKGRITRYSAAWGLTGLAITIASFSWYYRSIPADDPDACRFDVLAECLGRDVSSGCRSSRRSTRPVWARRGTAQSNGDCAGDAAAGARLVRRVRVVPRVGAQAVGHRRLHVRPRDGSREE